MKTDIHFWLHLAQILIWTRNVSDESCREDQNTQFMFGDFFFENRAFMRECGKKYCRAGHAIDDNMAYAHCMLDT